MGRQKGRRKTKATANEGSVITLGSLTHVGMKRSSNQDNYCALVGSNSPAGTDALLAVADGMGGHRAGEVASKMAIQGLMSRLARDGAKEATQPTPGQHDAALRRVVQEMNAEVNRAGARPETRGMGTTLTAALLIGRGLFIAHVGDSRGYLLRNGKMPQVTRDHSWVAEEVARGTLTAEQAREHPRRNVLTRAMGIAADVEVDTSVVELQEGDKLLLCSDGLHGLVTDEEIRRTLATEEPQQACDSLVQQANERGGTDNITVVVARIDKIGKDAGPIAAKQDLHKMTTLRVGASPSVGRGLVKVLRILLSQLWVPFWIVAKLVRALFSRGK